MRKWQILQTQVVFNTPFFSIRKDTCRLTDGHIIDDYYVMVSPHIAIVFALTPNHEVILVEQYKHGVGDICLELPGGLFDKEDAKPQAAAQREFREETGYDTALYFELGVFAHDPTRTATQVHAFLALDAAQVGEQNLDENEAIVVKKVPLADLPDLIRSGRIVASDSVAVIWQALDYLQQQRIVE